jgi:hypothetical protein
MIHMHVYRYTSSHWKCEAWFAWGGRQIFVCKLKKADRISSKATFVTFAFQGHEKLARINLSPSIEPIGNSPIL